MIKKAMILAAGFGKRLYPLTLNYPKPLLRIGNETLLSNTLKFLEKFGIEKVVNNVHYLGDQIIDNINKNKFKMVITLIKEKDKILDTGGAVLNAINHFLKEPFLIINPDTIWNISYLEKLKTMEKEFFVNKKTKCYLLVVNKEKSFDQSFKGDFTLVNKLVSRKRKREDLRYIYTGLQIIKPEVFSDLDMEVFSMNRIWDKLIENDYLYGLESDVDFFHVSTFEIYKKLKKNLNIE